MNRRHFIHRVCQASALAVCSPVFGVVLAQPSLSEKAAMRLLAEGFLREQGLQGMAIAYGKEGEIAFEEGYGFADDTGKEVMTPAHRFRIASISKPFTATAVMMCVERGLLKLERPVFGAQGILGVTKGDDLAGITVDHLLRHMSGGWANDKDDPMFQHPAMNHDELIAWTLTNQKPAHPPGTHYAYSNFGYCVLGRVLEKITKLPYETHMAQEVLSKCGLTSMKIAGNTLAARQPGEVMYVTEPPGNAYGMNVTRMDSHGGWLSTAGDLVRFASQLPKLLNEESIHTMTASGAGESYARGWFVNKAPNWWHSGSLPGTSTIMVHSANGVCWAGLLNSRRDSLTLDKLMWRMGRAVKAWGL